MKLEKCPICAKKMKEQNGRVVCPECGYYQIIDKNKEPAAVSAYAERQPAIRQPSAKAAQLPFQPQSTPQLPPRITVSVGRASQAPNHINLIFSLIFGVLFLAAVIIAVFSVLKMRASYDFHDFSQDAYESYETEYDSSISHEAYAFFKYSASFNKRQSALSTIAASPNPSFLLRQTPHKRETGYSITIL